MLNYNLLVKVRYIGWEWLQRFMTEILFLRWTILDFPHIRQRTHFLIFCKHLRAHTYYVNRLSAVVCEGWRHYLKQVDLHATVSQLLVQIGLSATTASATTTTTAATTAASCWFARRKCHLDTGSFGTFGLPPVKITPKRVSFLLSIVSFRLYYRRIWGLDMSGDSHLICSSTFYSCDAKYHGLFNTFHTEMRCFIRREANRAHFILYEVMKPVISGSFSKASLLCWNQRECAPLFISIHALALVHFCFKGLNWTTRVWKSKLSGK